MVTLLIALFCAAASGCALYFTDIFGGGMSSFCGIAVFGVIQIGAGLRLRKKVAAEMKAVETVLLEGQKAAQEKMQRWQMRPPGSVQAAQAEIERDQRKFVMEALKLTEPLHKFDLWVPMMKRQIATAQFQLYWMIKEFRKCDTLMEKALFVDPTMYAMKMARYYMLDKPTDEIRKVYEKGTKRLRYNQNTLLAAAWTWILVKRGEIDAAFKALNEALKNSDNETLKANREALANNRVAHFNNSGIGDTWWALALEEPKVKMQRQRMQWR
jgi:tetratricopeptide (TPR) repeat protein